MRRQLVDHLRIAQRLELRELHECAMPDRRDGLFDELQIPAAAFDVQDVLVVTPRLVWRSLTEVLPPPCSTSDLSRPSNERCRREARGRL